MEEGGQRGSDPSADSDNITLVIEIHSSNVEITLSQVDEISKLTDCILFSSSVFDLATASISVLRAEI